MSVNFESKNVVLIFVYISFEILSLSLSQLMLLLPFLFLLSVAQSMIPVTERTPEDWFVYFEDMDLKYKGYEPILYQSRGELAVLQNARDAASMKRICDRCRSAGLTWEGIWDGDVCVGLNRFMARKVINEAKKCA